MTAGEWFAVTNPDLLLRVVHPLWFAAFESCGLHMRYDVEARLRLFGCAAARMVWELLPTDARSAVLISERVAKFPAATADLRAAAVRIEDGSISYQRLAVNAAGWASAGSGVPPRWQLPINRSVLRFDPAEAGRSAAKAIATQSVGPSPPGYIRRNDRWHVAWTEVYNEARATQSHYVRDIFPPPDYTPQFNPEWLTSTVIALAQNIDESGDFSIVPILADALQDAGCEDETLLQCCRAPGNVHVRGNWVVDLVLGRG